MFALKRASAVAFYLLGGAVILGITFVSRGMFTAVLPKILHSLDLPLLASGMLYGGTSLVLSLRKERVSVGLAIVVFGILGTLFLGFAILNFRFPYPSLF